MPTKTVVYHRSYDLVNWQPILLRIFQPINLVKNVVLWWHCLCYLCLILNIKCDQTTVHGTYSEADELINELDRPSKYFPLQLFYAYIILIDYHLETLLNSQNSNGKKIFFSICLLKFLLQFLFYINDLGVLPFK